MKEQSQGGQKTITYSQKRDWNLNLEAPVLFATYHGYTCNSVNFRKKKDCLPFGWKLVSVNCSSPSLGLERVSEEYEDNKTGFQMNIDNKIYPYICSHPHRQTSMRSVLMHDKSKRAKRKLKDISVSYRVFLHLKKKSQNTFSGILKVDQSYWAHKDYSFPWKIRTDIFNLLTCSADTNLKIIKTGMNQWA